MPPLDPSVPPLQSSWSRSAHCPMMDRVSRAPLRSRRPRTGTSAATCCCVRERERMANGAALGILGLLSKLALPSGSLPTAASAQGGSPPRGARSRRRPLAVGAARPAPPCAVSARQKGAAPPQYSKDTLTPEGHPGGFPVFLLRLIQYLAIAGHPPRDLRRTPRQWGSGAGLALICPGSRPPQGPRPPSTKSWLGGRAHRGFSVKGFERLWPRTPTSTPKAVPAVLG